MMNTWVSIPARPSLAASDDAIEDAFSCARHHDVAIAVAIVDSAGQLICFKRMDTARPIAADLAMCKARTAAVFQRDTSELQIMAASGSPAFGVQHHDFASAGILPGGIPLRSDAGLHGAVGVSGADRERDIACARAACLSLLKKEQE